MAVADKTEVNGPELARAAGVSLIDVRQLLDLANILTIAGLASAIGCALLAINGHVAYAVVALMFSGMCDLFDGFVARRLTRTPQQASFGGHLDSIVDACSFGFAPVVLMYASGMTSWAEIPLLILFASCAVWRLAYFDTVGLHGSGRRHYYAGMPTTYVAVFLPFAFLAGFWGHGWLRGCVAVTAVALSLAMISTVPVRKPGGVWYLLFPVGGVVLTVLFTVFAGQFLP